MIYFDEMRWPAAPNYLPTYLKDCGELRHGGLELTYLYLFQGSFIGWVEGLVSSEVLKWNWTVQAKLKAIWQSSSSN